MPSPTFTHVQGMRHAAPVLELSASSLSREEFWDKFVAKSLPCVIKGAVSHWPAMRNWRDKEYIKKRSGHRQVHYYPHENFASPRQERQKEIISLSEALDRLHDENVAVGFVGTNNAVELLADTGDLPFLGKVQPAFFYPFIRHFMYRNAGSTWHYHAFDETLMCQIVGTKRVGMLSLDNPHHFAIRNIFFLENYYDDPGSFAAFENAELNWFTATVQEGDALYIPPLWWHGVITVSDGFGITAPVPWRSPLPVIADGICKMAAGNADIVGKRAATNVRGLVAVARSLGLEKELALALQRGY
jgi:hypothetical protein